MNTELLFSLLTDEETEAFDRAIRVLEAAGYEGVVCPKRHYIVAVPARGPLSQVALVAHLDTLVPKDRKTGLHLKPVELQVDNQVVTNKNGVLGADDRAGVYAVLEAAVQAKGKKPIVILTTGEEIGGIGVHELVKDESLNPYLDSIRLFVEPDRKGANEYVYYSWMIPNAIAAFVEGFGYREDHGTYSDVATLTEATRIPHVNLSTGYYGQHTQFESLVLWQLEATVQTLTRMVETADLPRVLIEDEPVVSRGRYPAGLAWLPTFDPVATRALEQLASEMGFPLNAINLEDDYEREEIYAQAHYEGLVDALDVAAKNALKDEFNWLELEDGGGEAPVEFRESALS